MVQFMDATMWMDHPRTAAMREFLSDVERFGQLKTIHSNLSFIGGPDFLTNNIRVNPDLDSLGALGDIGWYCIRSILWAANFQLPKTAVALRQPVLNEAGVILSCGSSLYWEDGKITIFSVTGLTHHPLLLAAQCRVLVTSVMTMCWVWSSECWYVESSWLHCLLKDQSSVVDMLNPAGFIAY